VKEKTTILIADDNADFAMTLVNYLEKEEDLEVIGVAKNGKEACDMVMNTRTRCIITRCNNAIFRWYWCIRIHKFIKYC
jgi:DNA-binding NarL/FixJ family response regulator